MSSANGVLKRKPVLDRLLRIAPGFLLAVAGLVGLVPDLLSVTARFVLALLLGVVAVACFFWSERRERNWSTQYVSAETVNAFADSHERLIDEDFARPRMADLADVLLSGSGAGRLTVYDVRDAGGKLRARALLRYASNRMFEDVRRTDFDVGSSFLRGIERAALSAQSPVFYSESGTFPDPDDDFDGWVEEQASVVGADEARTLRMRSVKYGWAVVADRSDQRRIIALMVESTDGAGLRVAELKSPLIQVVLNQFLVNVSSLERVKSRASTIRRSLDL